MRRAAFRLVALVIGVQLTMISAALAGCFFTRDERCTGDRVQELMTFITAQTFALYAAEK